MTATLSDYPGPLTTNQTILAIIFAVIGLIGAIENAIVLLVIGRRKQLHTTYNWMIFNLAVADLGFMVLDFIVCMSFLVTNKIYPAGHISCVSNAVTIFIFGQCSFFLLCSIAFERYYTLAREKGLKLRETIRIIIACWVCSIFNGIVMVLTVPITVHFDLFCFFDLSVNFPAAIAMIYALFSFSTPLIITVGFYYRVYRKINFVFNQQSVRITSTFRHQVRITKRMILILLMFICNWGMYLICPALYATITHQYPSSLLNAIASILVHLNSVINPILYAILDQRFFTELKYFFTPDSRRPNLHIREMSSFRMPSFSRSSIEHHRRTRSTPILAGHSGHHIDKNELKLDKHNRGPSSPSLESLTASTGLSFKTSPLTRSTSIPIIEIKL